MKPIVMVPRTPTPKMIDAGLGAYSSSDAPEDEVAFIFETMVAAAPGQSCPTLLERAKMLNEKTSMPWRDAEELALRESGVEEEDIDQLIGECGAMGLDSVIATPDDLRDFTRSLLVQASATDGVAFELRAEIDRLNAIVNSPQSNDFLRAVSTEAEHQRQRWGSEHDTGKTPADWFWLVGYLAGKALHAHTSGTTDKAEHHIITTAAALANWHLSMFGGTNMRPGTDGGADFRKEPAVGEANPS